MFTLYLLQDTLERTFGKIKWLAGSQRSFGALSFTRLLRNFILGCGEVIPQPKKSNVLPDDPENDKTGFEDATADLTTSVKGQLISKYPFGVFKSTKKPMKFLWKRSDKKKVLYITK